MSRLLDLQSNLSAAILTGTTGLAGAVIVSDRLDPGSRVQIHRNHFLTTLSEALAATFPVVARLVGDRCFVGLARRFIEMSPPATPCMFEYGKDFAYFLANQPILYGVPYVADMARLEWAFNEADTAADAPQLTPADLSSASPNHWGRLGFTLHPSVGLVSSTFPIDRIWRAHQGTEGCEIRVDLKGPTTRLLILRDRDNDVAWRRLSAPESAFLRGLRAGRGLDFACETARDKDSRFNAPGFLGDLLHAGAFAGITLT